MAISKSLETGGGVPLEYHRIANVSSQVNEATFVTVVSYTSQEKRAEEKDALAEGAEFDVFMETTLVELPYSDGMTVSEAYSLVKSLPEFEGAQDVWEEGQVIAE